MSLPTHPYSVADTVAVMALNRKIILGQNSCKWVTTVRPFGRALTYMEKTVGLLELENRCRFP
jgi:hypothetical protein